MTVKSRTHPIICNLLTNSEYRYIIKIFNLKICIGNYMHLNKDYEVLVAIMQYQWKL